MDIAQGLALGLAVDATGVAYKSLNDANKTDSSANGTWEGLVGSMDEVHNDTFMDCNGSFCRGTISMGKQNPPACGRTLNV